MLDWVISFKLVEDKWMYRTPYLSVRDAESRVTGSEKWEISKYGSNEGGLAAPARSIVLWTRRLQVPSPVRACMGGSQSLFLSHICVSLPLFLPSPLSKNKGNLKKKTSIHVLSLTDLRGSEIREQLSWGFLARGLVRLQSRYCLDWQSSALIPWQLIHMAGKFMLVKENLSSLRC